MSTTQPERIEELVQMAEEAFERGEIEEAYRQLVEAAEHDESHPQVLNDMGAILASGGCSQQAEAYFRKALEIDPDLDDAYVNLGRILLANGRVEEARRVLDLYRVRGRTADHDMKELEKLLGAATKTRGGRIVAVESLDRAAEVWPDRMALYEVIGSHLWSGARVLDVSGFSGFGPRLLHERGALVSTFISDEGLAAFARSLHAPTGLIVECCDPVSGLEGVESCSQDAVVAVGIEDEGRVLERVAEELVRVTKPGGLLLLASETHEGGDLQDLARTEGTLFAALERTGGLRLMGDCAQTESLDLLCAGRARPRGWVLMTWQKACAGVSLDTRVWVSGFERSQPCVILADWRRTVGDQHLHLRRAFAGLGFRLVDAGFGELEELTSRTPLPDTQSEVDVEGIVAAVIGEDYGPDDARDPVLHDQVRERFGRLHDLFRRAAATFSPRVVVTCGERSLETLAAREAVLEFGLGHVVVDESIYVDRSVLELLDGRTGNRFPSPTARFDWLRWHMPFDSSQDLPATGEVRPQDGEPGGVETLRDRLEISPGATVGILVLGGSRRPGAVLGRCGFESVWDLIADSVAALQSQPGHHLVIWLLPDCDLDGSGRDPLLVLKERRVLRRNVSAVVAVAEELRPLLKTTAWVIGVGCAPIPDWVACNRPVIWVGEAPWSGLGFTRDVTRRSQLGGVLEEVMRDPLVSARERRLRGLFFADYRDEVLVPLGYEAVRDALATRLAAVGGLPMPLAALATCPDWRPSEPQPPDSGLTPEQNRDARVNGAPVFDASPRTRRVTAGATGVHPATYRGPESTPDRQDNPDATCEISIIIPSADRPEILEELLEDLSHQTLDARRFEVIVTDDGTQPPLSEALSDLVLPYSMQLLRSERRGPSAARNLAIRHARGRYLLILNDDAAPLRDLVERHLVAQQSAPEPRAYLGELTFQGSFDTPLARALSKAGLLFPYHEMDRTGPNPGRFFWTCNISVPKASVEQVGGFDETFAYQSEDVELGYRLSKTGVHVFFLDGACCGHRHLIDASWFERRQLSLGVQMVKLFRKHGDVALLPGRRAFEEEAALQALEGEVRARGGRRLDLVEAIQETVDREDWNAGSATVESVAAGLLSVVRRLSDDSITIGLLAGFKRLEIDEICCVLGGMPGRTTLVIPVSGRPRESIETIHGIRQLAGAPIEVLALVGPGTLKGGDPFAVLPDARGLELLPGETLVQLRSRVLELANGEHLAFVNWGCRYSENWLQGLVDVLDRDASIGAVGPRLVAEAGEFTAAGDVEEVERLDPHVVVTGRRAVEQTLQSTEGKDFLERLKEHGYRLVRVASVEVAPPVQAAVATT